MLKFMDGFDQFVGESPLASALTLCGYTVSGDGPTIEEGRKTGSRCLQFNGSIGRTFTTSSSTVVFGFAYKATAERGDILTIKDVGTLSWNSVVSFGATQGSAIPLVNLWYYYEVVIDKGAKEVRVYINNELDMTAALPDNATFMQDYSLTWSGSATDAKQIDDLLFIDGAAGRFRDRVGPVQLGLRMPRSDVVTQFSPSNGSSHYPMVNQVPSVEGNYVQSNVSGAADTFRSTDNPPEGDILAVGIVAKSWKSDIDGRQFGMLVGDAEGVNTEVLQPTMNTIPTFSYAVFESDPTGAAWNTDTIASTPFGVKVRP